MPRILLFANANPEAGHRGITCFLVEAGMEGFAVGKKEDKLGIRASSTCELILDDCRVPAANVLGEVGKGYKIAIETLNEGRIAIGAQMAGLAQGALRHAIAYAKERRQHGKVQGTGTTIHADGLTGFAESRELLLKGGDVCAKNEVGVFHHL